VSRYTDLRPSLSTGDVVLFAGTSLWSHIIKLFSKGKWSHVGMVVRLAELDDAVMLYESTPRTGVHLASMSEVVRGYKGKMALRRLTPPITPGMHASLAEVRAMLAHRPYERSESELARAALDFILPRNHRDVSSIFCSELVAECYRGMGLLTWRRPPNEYTPSDFARMSTLSSGYQLGPVEVLTA